MRITSGPFTSAIISVPFIISIIMTCKKAKKYYRIKVFFLILLFIYSLNLFKYAVFPIYVFGTIKESMQNDQSLHLTTNLNLFPFLRNFYFKDFVLNIIMTAPLGFLVPCLRKNVKKRIFFLGILIGFFLEFIQAVLGLMQGFTFRDININDSIANACGVYVGYLMFVFFRNVLLKIPFKENKRFLSSLQNYFEQLMEEESIRP